jgi:hypothetical protein
MTVRISRYRQRRQRPKTVLGAWIDVVAALDFAQADSYTGHISCVVSCLMKRISQNAKVREFKSLAYGIPPMDGVEIFRATMPRFERSHHTHESDTLTTRRDGRAPRRKRQTTMFNENVNKTTGNSSKLAMADKCIVTVLSPRIDGLSQPSGSIFPLKNSNLIRAAGFQCRFDPHALKLTS